MCPDSSEQESYTLDEMLERLREGEREKRGSGETSTVVTRPDGTKVRRVRRRKRRTDQPSQPAPRKKFGGKGLVVLLVVAAVVVLAIALFSLLRVARFNSEGYQKELEQALADSLGADVSVQRLSVTPAVGRAEKVSLRWPDGALVESALFQKVQVPLGLGGFVQGKWTGTEVVSERGSARVVSPRALSPVPGAGEMPLGHERFRCKRFTGTFGAGENPAMRIEGASMTLTRGTGGARQVIVRGGRMHLSGCEPLDLEIGTARVTGNELKLTALRLRERGGKGAIEVSGLADVRPNDLAVLVFRLAEMPVGPLLGKGASEVFNAVAGNSEGRIEIDTSGTRPMEIRIPVDGVDATLSGFPFLMSLRTMFGHTDYGSPIFDEYSMTLHRVGDLVRLEDINLQKRNALLIRGSLAFDRGQEVSGVLQVGVPESRMITRTNRKRWEPFREGGDGYYWVDITVGGTVDRLEDNLEATLRNSVAPGTTRESE